MVGVAVTLSVGVGVGVVAGYFMAAGGAAQANALNSIALIKINCQNFAAKKANYVIIAVLPIW